MIPDIDPALIENSGEQRFYEAACELPDAFTVYYRYRFSTGEFSETPESIFEADFIIVHPRLGYLVVEVKEGQFQYFNNRWQKQLGASYVDYDKDPTEQAVRAMYSILDKYKQAARSDHFPLKICYAVCFPDCRHLAGSTPDNLKPESIWLCGHLENLEKSIRGVFGREEGQAGICSKKEVTHTWISGNFTKTKKVNGVGNALPRMEKLLVPHQKDIKINPTARQMRAVMVGKVNFQPYQSNVTSLLIMNEEEYEKK